MGAIANAIGYYTIGLPIGISLMFAAKMGVLGMCVLCLVLGVWLCTSCQHCFFWAKPYALSKGSALELMLRSSFGLVGLDCTLKSLSEAGSE